jgi:hypothetical protein
VRLGLTVARACSPCRAREEALHDGSNVARTRLLHRFVESELSEESELDEDFEHLANRGALVVGMEHFLRHRNDFFETADRPGPGAAAPNAP